MVQLNGFMNGASNNGCTWPPSLNKVLAQPVDSSIVNLGVSNHFPNGLVHHLTFTSGMLLKLLSTCIQPLNLFVVFGK